MKKSIFALSISLVAVMLGYPLYGQMSSGMMQGGAKSPQMMSQGMMSGGMKGCEMMKDKMGMHGQDWTSSRHLSKIFKKAEDLVDEDLKGKVRSLKNSTLAQILRQQAEVKIVRMRAGDLLGNPSFDEGEAKGVLRSLKEQEMKLGEQAITGLAKLRKLVGEDTYEKALEVCPMGKGMMAGSREEGSKMMPHKGGMMSPEH